MSLKLQIWIISIALIITLGLSGWITILKSEAETQELKLTTANESIAREQDTNKQLRADKQLLEDVIRIRREVEVQTFEREEEIAQWLEGIETTLRNYKPKEDNDESRCLGLIPPADFIEWLQQHSPRDQNSNEIRTSGTEPQSTEASSTAP